MRKNDSVQEKDNIQKEFRGVLVGVAIAIIFFALAGVLAVFIALGFITKQNAPILLMLFGVLFVLGIVILLWSLWHFLLTFYGKINSLLRANTALIENRLFNTPVKDHADIASRFKLRERDRIDDLNDKMDILIDLMKKGKE